MSQQTNEELKKFGYYFDEQLKLKSTKFSNSFEFINSHHYDLIGNLVVSHIYELLKERYAMKELWLPRIDEEYSKDRTNPQVNIFVTPNWKTCKKLLILICGSGAVRAGQWTRQLCLYNTLNEGTCFQYLEEAIKDGFGVMILNPNLHFSKTIIQKNTIKKSTIGNEEKNIYDLNKRIKKAIKIINLRKIIKLSNLKVLNYFKKNVPKIKVSEILKSIFFKILINLSESKNIKKEIKIEFNKYFKLFTSFELSQSDQFQLIYQLEYFLKRYKQIAKVLYLVLNELYLNNILNQYSIISWYKKNTEGKLQRICKGWIKTIYNLEKKEESTKEKSNESSDPKYSSESRESQDEKEVEEPKKEKKKKDDLELQESQNLFNYFFFEKKICGHSSAKEHTKNIWENLVMKAKSKEIYIVAHSYGGVCTTYLLKKFFKEFKKRIVKIAFTDSVHFILQFTFSKDVKQWFYTHSRNWVKSKKKVGMLVNRKLQGVYCVSAGHQKHIWTSTCAKDSIFKWFRESYQNNEN
ncbi:hypothetical protein M0813_14764 [Anaeramoeba flamelloides]|uniref:W2 domain-containing protein n=1 Tax=Anaeramoeba flamelloides TaxID=1746091 RepID=A0ABQ8Z553_9EUKA|nr:hypothetical protein M0813_14764 [Anaeramoeba flamelloides]